MSFEAFKNSFLENYQKFLRTNQLRKEIEKADERIIVLNSAILKISGLKVSYPLIVGNGLSRASIVEMGEFPPFGFTQHWIYPINFKVKKRFKAHAYYKKSLGNKVLYLCCITKDGIVITADDGYQWKGENLWNEFKSDLGIENEFCSIEDFMSLNNPTVIKMIESLGDISLLNGYIPFSERQSSTIKQ
jgi:hypothetical protein